MTAAPSSSTRTSPLGSGEEYQRLSDSSSPELDQRVEEATRPAWRDLLEGMQKSKVGKALTVTLLAAATITLIFALASNPVGWAVSAIGLSLLAAKVITGLALLLANLAAYGLSSKETKQKVELELGTLWRMMPGVTNYNEISLKDLTLGSKNKITPKLYVGAIPNRNRPGNSIPPDVQAVIANNEKFELSPFGLSNPLTKGHWAERGIDFKPIETKDHLPITAENMDEAADFIYEQIVNGKSVLSHCLGGKGRSATSAAAFMMKYCRNSKRQALSIEEICVRIKAGRKKSTIWNKLHALRDYDDYLQANRGNRCARDPNITPSDEVTRPKRSSDINRLADQLKIMEDKRNAGSKQKPEVSKKEIESITARFKDDSNIFPSKTSCCFG